ncbi:hypothetical protein OHB12_12325 [Nocardia sp. NBC_01730]|uniref:hypothetical protein n=1 Tax=Nocardia sp. NBC_01730 TaxID=2975998 RepID=UPI002E10374A|nr:hypothetical protein OHB12_12325 [Nocardia sp. NBC_01730]
MGRAVHNPPPQYPGYRQEPPAQYYPPTPPVPAGKPKGGKTSGLLLMILGVFPVLLGCGVMVKAIINGQQVTTNNAFAAVAWHNLTSDQIFPDYLTDISIGDHLQGWSRQSIANETSCAEAFSRDFAAKLAGAGCKTALRATYVDMGGTMAATLGVAVVDSYQAADAVNQEFNWSAGTGPLVYPVAVPNTPAASWNKDLAMAGGAAAIGLSTTSPPYLAAISVGPVDNSRSWTSLPGQWSSDARSQKRIFQDVSNQVIAAYARSTMLTGDQK